MKIFITVGTTPFNELIRFCEKSLSPDRYTIKAQISDLASYRPNSFESFAYTKNITDYYEWADVIIAHAGAGTFYQLMEIGKKVIFVPNHTMKDNHQNDICRYALDNNLAFVLGKPEQLIELLDTLEKHHFTKYHKPENSIARYLYDIVLNYN